MNFSIRIKGSAAKELKRVVKQDRTRIVAAIDRLTENPFLGNALKGDLRGLRRLRVGDFRVLYEVREDVLVVLVIRVAHRRDVYRRRFPPARRPASSLTTPGTAGVEPVDDPFKTKVLPMSPV